MIEARCHCGNIKITVPDSTETVTCCNCSACSKYASLWAYFSPLEVEIVAKKDTISSYSWGDKTIKFHHCNNCGCLTHYTPTQLGNKDKMAVNFRLVNATILSSLNTRFFDGADTWSEIKS
ncbi:aldehyde-activating protein [Colwellia sp. 75C3]|uniref:GFA family protein n=1 Tax=Colwellia sp. 75C3 TaxID=888425 RepID=UPI000C3324DB|nr:aldehyde-activating protein [Colwellia sp. 75C3]PKG81913.1 aldehyde-activating protein [Colwellia sp. 75C3]